MTMTGYLFAAGFLFVGVMLALSFRKRGLPPSDDLRKRLSPKLREFLGSLPLPDDDPLADFCQPWAPKEDIGYNKKFLALWQTRGGEPSYVNQYIKLGSPVEFGGVAHTKSEQAFLAAMVFSAMERDYHTDRPAAIRRGRRASEALGFKYFDELLDELTRPHPRDPENAGDEETESDRISDALVQRIERLE